MHMRVLAIGFGILIGMAGLCLGQDREFKASTIDSVVEITEPTCFEATFELRDLAGRVELDELIIIVSRLGKAEKGALGKRRLHNAAETLSNYPPGGSGRTLVLAEAEPNRDRGVLEIFVKGRLELRIVIARDKELYVSPCVHEPNERPCSTADEPRLYPCKKG